MIIDYITGIMVSMQIKYTKEEEKKNTIKLKKTFESVINQRANWFHLFHSIQTHCKTDVKQLQTSNYYYQAI